MKILLNLTRLLPLDKGAGGAGRVAIALAEKLPQYCDLRVLIPEHHRGLIAQFSNTKFIVISSNNLAEHQENLSWCDCYLDPLNALRPIDIPESVAVVSVIHDLQHLEMPWFFSESELKFRSIEYQYAVDRSDRLIAVSHFEKTNFERYYGIDKVDVAYNSGFIGESPSMFNEDGTSTYKADYVIYPAVPWNHKNHETLLQAFAVIKAMGHKIDLVLTNLKGNIAIKSRLASLASEWSIAENIAMLDFVPEHELRDLMVRSRGLVFPSLYEGFGIPLVDAMKLGVGVLASKTSAIPEICKDFAEYFDNSFNPIAMARNIVDFVYSPKNVVNLNCAQRHASNFNSEKMALDYLSCCEKAVMQNKKGLKPQMGLNYPVGRFKRLAILVLVDVHHLMQIGAETAAFAIQNRGSSEVSITYALDPKIVDSDELRECFINADRVIIRKNSEELDDSVLEFARRFDDGEYHCIVSFPYFTGYSNAEELKYLADELHILKKTCYSEIHSTESLLSCSAIAHIDPLCLRYQKYLSIAGHFFIDNVIIRRGSVSGLNGSPEFLASFVASLASNYSTTIG